MTEGNFVCIKGDAQPIAKYRDGTLIPNNTLPPNGRIVAVLPGFRNGCRYFDKWYRVELKEMTHEEVDAIFGWAAPHDLEPPKTI